MIFPLDYGHVVLPPSHPRAADGICPLRGFAIDHPDGVICVDTGCGTGFFLYPHHVERLGLLDQPHGYYEARSPTLGDGVLFSAVLARAQLGPLALRDVPTGLFSKASETGLAADRTRAGFLPIVCPARNRT